MNILTFDIEEWYLNSESSSKDQRSFLSRLNALLDSLLDDLGRYELKATFFCLGAIAREYPGVIKTIISRGHEIGCHSDKHKWLTSLTPKEFECDTKMAIDSLEQVTGKKIRGYRAPAFSIGESNKWVLEILSMHGVEYDASIFPAKRDFGGFPAVEQQVPSIIHYNGIRMKEFPIGMMRMLWKELAYSGGGYFRLLPYSTIKTWVNKNDYVMTYLHLHDFDKEQKRKLSLRYFKSYYGINRAHDKFKQFISDFRFMNLEEANRVIDWNRAPVVCL
jgi:polysaccharide deacetylase family protein (PEP-CTERM system associated)